MIENQDLDFTGRRVLVTGAAGGIGSAMAAAFAAHGGQLILADLDGEAIEQQAGELGRAPRSINMIRAMRPRSRNLLPRRAR